MLLTLRLNLAAAGGAYTLDVTAGSVTLTGQSIALRVARQVAVTAGTVTLTGQSVALRVGRTINVTDGSLALTGQSTTLKADRRVAVTAGAVALAGQTVALTAAREIDVTAGSVTLTGETVSLSYSGAAASLDVISGSITLTGQEVALTYTPAVVTPPATGGGGGAMVLGRRAGSGRWRRVDEDVSFIDARDAHGAGRASVVDLAPLIVAHGAVGGGRSSSVEVTAWAVPQVRSIPGGGRVPVPVQPSRDDTAEILRLLTLVRAAQRRSPAVPDDVAAVLDVIGRMKKKAA